LAFLLGICPPQLPLYYFVLVHNTIRSDLQSRHAKPPVQPEAGYAQRRVQGETTSETRGESHPRKLVNWMEGFCSDCTAGIQVNGQNSRAQALPHGGLPQASPLSPILFIFFNADLEQHQINPREGRSRLWTTTRPGPQDYRRNLTVRESRLLSTEH